MDSSSIDVTPTFKPSGKFRNDPVFDCPNDVFYSCVQGRRKHQHWRTFLKGGEFAQKMKLWMEANPKSRVILRNEMDGSMFYVK